MKLNIIKIVINLNIFKLLNNLNKQIKKKLIGLIFLLYFFKNFLFTFFSSYFISKFWEPNTNITYQKEEKVDINIIIGINNNTYKETREVGNIYI